MRELSGVQTRQLIDSEQVYVSWREAERDYVTRYAGSMAWKSIGGRRYLYRKTAGVWKSLGPDNEATQQTHDRFHAGRDALKARRASLEGEIRAMAPVNRAMRLGRVPWTSARVLRRLDRIGALGRGLRVAGTHAIYAYERMGGVHFGVDIVTTLDIDLLYDARGGLDIVASDLADIGLMGVLRSVDSTFAPTAADSFRAANAKGFMVDLITPSSRHPATRVFRQKLGDDPGDLSAVEIDGLAWLESSPAVEAIAIDERGYPLLIVAPDPRAFACHKLWLAQRSDRDPLKQRRDRAQAEQVARMLVTHLPGLRFDDPALGALPAEVRMAGVHLARDVGQPAPGIDGLPDWA